MSFLFFTVGREFGGRPIIIIRKFYVPPASKDKPYNKIETVYQVTAGNTLLVPRVAIYSENEVVKGKLLQDRSPIITFQEAIWGNPELQPAGITAETDVSIELTNETAQSDTVWIQLIGIELPTDRVGAFIERLKSLGGWIC